MFGYGYGFGRGSGFGYGRRFGGGNPTPYCRAYPWLPRGWWKWGYRPYNGSFEFDLPYRSFYGERFSENEFFAIKNTLKGISETLTEIENKLAEMEKK